MHFELKLKLMFVHIVTAAFKNNIFNTVPHSLQKQMISLRRLILNLTANRDCQGEKPQEVTMQLAISSGLPSAIEIHILEESLETMRVGELG